ncbi:hypothetical protein DYH09_01830 [bacterium CPR1]|nr:hypothetical protein [bacterium CPR1]
MAGKKERAHASLKLYAKIIISLTLITVAEIVVPYLIAHNQNSSLGVAMLLILAVAKYVLVVAFFMHLYYDQPLFTFMFVTGMVLAGGTLAALVAVAPPHTPAGQKQDQAATGGPAQSQDYTGPKLSAEGEKGLELFETKCAVCHELATVKSATGVVGPTLNGIWETGARRVPGQNAEQYIDLSIKDPAAYIVEGYPNSMTNYGFPDADRKALVTFLMAQKDAGKAAPSPSGNPEAGGSPAASPGR